MKITRRRRIAAIVAAGSAAALVTGCSAGGGEPEPDPSGSTITYAVQSFAHEAIQPIVDEFTAETGIKVKLESGPSSGADLLTQLVPSFTSNTSPYDVIDADDPAGAALVAGDWLEPLPGSVTEGYLGDLTQGMADAQKQWNEKDGQTYRLYHNWELGYAWANEELLAEYDLEVPKTWEDIETIGAALKEDGIYAFGDAASKPGLTFVYLAYLAAQSGGDIYSADEGTREAFEFAKKLIDEGYFPKDALTWTYDQSNAAYMGDQLATMRQWTFFDGVAQANTEWYAPDKAVVVDPPAGPAGSKTWAGGWGMVVPKAASNKAGALKFVEWMNQPEIAVKLAEASSFFVTARTSVLDQLGDEGIVASLKHYSESGFVVPRPYHAQAAQAETIVDNIGQSYLTGQIDIDEAMEQLSTQIEALG